MTLDQMDAEANAFAFELLMPREWLLRDIAEIGAFDIEDDAKLKRLAARYRVSVPVMTLRLGQVLATI